ncbi:hypothetical protein NDN08_003211 [Rhodosorus marinus]|uniref:BACK domain-containing protein n=1 Tax=Rhodosorus marinus TaxID=101924 RepID=A0AAV8UZH9_9RHOD|nr:hypothetical protein NDN08_003211 [Rhodosorus marinus]
MLKLEKAELWNAVATAIERRDEKKISRLLDDALLRDPYLLRGSEEQLSRFSKDTLLELVKRDCLPVSEDDLWRVVVNWAAPRAGIESDLIQLWKPEQVSRIREILLDFVHPPALRLFDISPKVFAEEVQPIEVLTEHDCIEKFRFDALTAFHSAKGMSLYDAKKTVFDEFYPACDDDSVDSRILDRVRRVPQMFESVHPHSVGASEQISVEMQPWCRSTLVLFDSRTELAEGAELSLNLDQEGQETFSSFQYSKSRKFLVVQKPKFMCLFQSGYHHHPKWGYKFLCIPMS